MFSSFLNWSKALPVWSKIVMSMIILFIAGVSIFMWQGDDLMNKAIDKYYEEKNIESLIYTERERIFDSINEIQLARFWKKSLDDELEIRELCERYVRLLDGETQLTLYKIHDHGDPFSPNSNALITVKWSSLNVIQDNYQEEPIYTGSLWASKQAIEDTFVYMPDIDSVPDYYRGREKAFHDDLGSKSGLFMHVKNTEDGRWFVAVHWNRKNPFVDSSIPRIKLGRLRSGLRPLIYEVPRQFKNKYK